MPSTSPQFVAVLVFPFTSHPHSLLQFVRSVSAVSPNTNFIYFNVTRSNASLFSGSNNNSSSLDNIKPYNIWDGLPEGYVPQSGLTAQIDLFLDKAPQIFKSSIKEVEEETGNKFSCLISDAFFCPVGDIAKEMQVPWVAYWGQPRSLLAHIETDMIRERVGDPGQENHTLDFLPGFTDQYRASDLPKEIVFGNPESPFARMLQQMGRKLPQLAASVAVNSFEMMDVEVITERLKKILPNLLLVGPLNLQNKAAVPSVVQSDNDCLQWLDKQKPASVVYISFGSLRTVPPVEVAALAEALEEGRFPFLWSFRGNQGDLPQGFVERTTLTSSLGKIVPWANQVQILNHPSVGVFATHCGWNSILESVTCGVPMIGRPGFGDQQLNMRSLEVLWRFGLRFEGDSITKTGALKALQQTLLLQQGKEMRHRVGQLKKLAHEAVGPNGRSVRDLKALVEIIKLSG